jgi:hypothetical protein
MLRNPYERLVRRWRAQAVRVQLLDCHPAEAREMLEALLQSQATYVYTIEKGGKQTLIYQAPWYEDGEYAGMVELQIALPEALPHFKRD